MAVPGAAKERRSLTSFSTNNSSVRATATGESIVNPGFRIVFATTIVGIVLAGLIVFSCGDDKAVSPKSQPTTGVAVINVVIPPAKSAVTDSLNPTTKAILSFYDRSGEPLTTKTFTVQNGRISGTISVKAGSGYRVELLCYDTSDNLTHAGTATDVTITAGKQTVITIVLTPETPGIPAASCADTLVLSGTKYTITWSEVSRAKSYTIEESPDSTFAEPTRQTIVGTSESFTKIAVERMSFHYRVCANNSAGSGNWSNVVAVIVEPVPTLSLIHI